MSARINMWAFLGLVTLSLAAFVAAAMFQSSGWLSFVPPATDARPNPVPDTDAENALALYQSAFTAWSTLLLLIPSYWFYLTRGAGREWLAFWTASFIAYLLHIFVAAFLFFGGDFVWMTSSSRVSAFWPGMFLILWWALDIGIALVSRTDTWVRLQRGALHLATFVLFFGGSAITGEMMTIKLIGAVFALVTIAGLISAWRRRSA